MAADTGIPLQILEQVLGPQPVPVYEEEVEALIPGAKTLSEITKIINHIPPGSKCANKARNRFNKIMEHSVRDAITIADWYEVLRYAKRHGHRHVAGQKIDAIFYAELASADSVEKLKCLWEGLPKSKNLLRHLRRAIILELATYYDVTPADA
ncbi:MAG: hypothetical protein JWN90_550 [Parcubacteria group bacterium]|nr:hypothetical protein [Parcubacteria group bacterium]